jgi:lipoprotein-anchoring transpeptidase ErfK/SrfK
VKRLIELGLLACAAASTDAHAMGHRSLSVVEKAARLRPGQYVWEAKVASAGPLFLVIDLSSQRATLYRNGVVVAASTVSTGGRGRETPTGVFTILQKEVVHRSRTYDDAPMPYMQRLTWRGVAMHAGHLPGYRASHGCIRLPTGFAKRLYAVTKLGTPVMIRA